MKLLIIIIALLVAVPCQAVEILIKAADNVNASLTAEEAERCLWKRGDFITCEETGFAWSAAELLAPAAGGTFVRLIVTDKTKAQAQAFIQKHLDGDGNLLHRARFRAPWTPLPAGVKSALWNQGYYSTTWAAIKAYLEDRTGGAIP